jgi:hypothetical protein
MPAARAARMWRRCASSMRRLREALTALEEAERRDDAPDRLARYESTYRQELASYKALCRTEHASCSGA